MTNNETPLDVITRVFSTLTDEYDRDVYISALRSRGWTLDPIALAANLTRFQVRAIESRITREDAHEHALMLVASGVPLPSPTAPAAPAPFHQRDAITGRRLSHAPDPSPETLERLRTLQPLVRQVRSSSPLYRKEAEEYTALLQHAITIEGTSVYRLAKLLGVTHGGLYGRLARYGYRSTTSKNRLYTPILPENRYTPEK